MYEALDLELGRKVALKMLRPTRSRRQLAEEWLRQEADACARLDHPGLVTLHDAGTSSAGPWLAMELLRGETLAERVARGPLQVADALEIALEIAEALGHAHSRGVLHRDLKPGNVFVTDAGRVKLLDLGLAHVLGTRASSSGGTPAYMAPEQARGEDVDARADVFAAGVILHELLTGSAPFAVSRGRNAAATGAPPPELPRSVPRAVRALVARCIAPDREARPANGDALAAELRRLAPATSFTPNRRRWLVAGAAAAVLAAIATLAVVRPWAPRQGPVGRSAIAVADVVNETKDPELEGISELLVTALEPSPHVQVLTRTRVADALRAAGRSGIERIDETLAIAVARDVGMKALLVPSVRRFGDSYSVAVRAIDPVADAYLFALKDEALDKRGVLAAIDRLAARARAHLGDSERELQAAPGVRAETIADLAAYRHYHDALRYSEQGLLDKEQEELRAALELDPRFALAHLRLAVSEYGFPPISAAERTEHLRAAQREAERLPEPDRLSLQAHLALEDRQLERAAALLEQAALLRPDKRTWYKLAHLRSTRDLAAGRPYFRKALALDPAWIAAQNDLALTYCWAGEHAEAERLVSEWATRWPSAVTYGMLNGTRLWAADFDGAMEAARRAEQLGPGPIAHVARTLIARGDFAAAEAELRRWWERGDRMLYDYNLADALRFRGKRREASRVLDDIERTGPAGAMIARERRLRVAAADGDWDRVAASLPEVARESDAFGRAALALALGAAHRTGDAEAVLAADSTAVGGGEAAMVDAARAVVAAARARDERDVVKARRILEDARARTPFAWQRTLDYFIGETCHVANDDACAVEALARVRPTVWGLPLAATRYHQALHLLAVSLDRLGRTDEARAVAEQLGGILAEADEDLPALAQARALCARLACRG